MYAHVCVCVCGWRSESALPDVDADKHQRLRLQVRTLSAADHLWKLSPARLHTATARAERLMMMSLGITIIANDRQQQLQQQHQRIQQINNFFVVVIELPCCT